MKKLLHQVLVYFCSPIIFYALILTNSSCTGHTNFSIGAHYLDSTQYATLGSNWERLYFLHQGFFVCEILNENTDNFVTDLKEGDSVLIYSKSAGCTLQDGYWLYERQFLAKKPNQPQYAVWKKIERVCRDSFVVHVWPCTTSYKLQELLAADFKFDIDFQNIESNAKSQYKSYSYRRLNYLQYKGYSTASPITQLATQYTQSQEQIVLLQSFIYMHHKFYETMPKMSQKSLAHEAKCRWRRLSKTYTPISVL